jgi:hypothetical protein
VCGHGDVIAAVLHRRRRRVRLVTLFDNWRAFERPALRDDAPDYG